MLYDSGGVETRLILGVVRICHTHTHSCRPALQLSSVGLGSMSLPGNASLVCIPPADEFTAGDHYRTIEVNPLVLDGGVL